VPPFRIYFRPVGRAEILKIKHGGRKGKRRAHFFLLWPGKSVYFITLVVEIPVMAKYSIQRQNGFVL
jgi:hypothetical protein